MGIKAALHHSTHYKYDRLVQLGPQVIRLRPAPHARTPISAYSIKIQPENHFINWQQDPFGNYLARIVFPEKTKFFKVDVDLIADIRVFNPFDFFLEDSALEFPFQYEDWLREELAPYLSIKENGSKLSEFVANVPKEKKAMVHFLVALNQSIHNRLKYLVRLEPGVQSCEETLTLGSGSCRDMAWLLCQVFRHIGLASRFTSGYLIQLKADEKALDGPSGTDIDFTDLHAWTEVYLPGAGWVGLDPTSGLFTGEGHIPLCSTPNPSSAAPITGMLETKCEAELIHKMDVTRVQEERRITKPYSDKDWDEINSLGQKVDQDISARDIRLTMGGEPTFISLADKEEEDWKEEALGDSKWKHALQLLKKMSEHYAPSGLLFFGQGKWYPGELLPRWAMGCFWRKDQKAIWKNKDLLAHAPSVEIATVKNSEEFLTTLAKSLGVDQSLVLPAYEDSPFYLWRDGKLPIDGEILSANLYDKKEHDRLQKLLYKDINKPTGFVLPLGYSFGRKKWLSNKWKFKNDKLLLSAGDSPLGYRLPLGSIPFVKDAEKDFYPEKNPFENTVQLPSYDEFYGNVSTRFSGGAIKDKKEDPCGYVRTALCVEPRNGFLNIFLPPVSYIENFLDLITSIEWTAQKLNMPVRIEGSFPPFDLRMDNFKLTPDPGVLEVNVQPAASWQEQVEITNTVYENARLVKLSADKFLIDGRRVGTGGGNHILVGGKTPSDSPFLRRPDLVRSMITFWQHHPSLSYLFSSLFVGPTSQSPRIDEARHESLYEMEIAFKELSKKSENPPLWLVDRLLRNLLVDITGNTHRAEFCIDKLYSPSGNTGRLGLLELRGFEMPPHPKMSLVQSLLIRACISGFWEKPYEGSLVRWGSRLHDQFMLPYYIWNDFSSVLSHLESFSYKFNKEWFMPLFEFRFPLIGRVQIEDIEIELRTALEPWPVMGEDSLQGTVSRGVDSTLERVQVLVKGELKPHQYISCNGHKIPLSFTDQSNIKVAGVRFKAWSQPVCLQPTIKPQVPLVFDLVDSNFERSLGGCTYHVAHPGGVNYDKLPVNENEAEGRRISRFQTMGHTAGKMKLSQVETNKDFPYTLDLRLYD